MKLKAIKQGKTLHLTEDINLPDGQEIMIDILDSVMIKMLKRFLVPRNYNYFV